MVNDGNHRDTKIIRKPFRQAGSNQIAHLYSSIKYILEFNDIVHFYFYFLIITTESTYIYIIYIRTYLAIGIMKQKIIISIRNNLFVVVTYVFFTE